MSNSLLLDSVNAAAPKVGAIIPSQHAVPPFTLIIATQNTPEKIQQTQRCVQFWQQGLSDLGVAIPVIVMPGEKSMAVAYNKALSQVATPYVILSHNDAFPAAIPPSNQVIGRKLLGHMENSKLDLAGFCGSSKLVGPRWQDCPAHLYGRVINIPMQPQPGQIFTACQWQCPAKVVTGIRALDGYCLIARTKPIRETGFDPSNDAFHFYDVAISATMADAGMRVGIICDISVLHQSVLGYAAPEWGEGTRNFQDKWRGKGDIVPQGIGFVPAQIQSGDLAAILRHLDLINSTLPAEVAAP